MPSEKSVLITGSGRRMGAAIAECLAHEGWSICIHYKSSKTEALNLKARLMSQFDIKAWTVCADLSLASETMALIARSSEAIGDVPDALINNASVFEYDDISHIDPQRWNAILDVNLRAPVLLSQSYANELNGKHACIVNILDQKIFNLNPDFITYTISKLALEGATRLLAMALAVRGVRVCGIAPGLSLPSGDQTIAEFEATHKLTPLGGSSAPTDIGNAVKFILNSPAITGQVLTVDGGQHMFPLNRDVMFLVRSGKPA